MKGVRTDLIYDVGLFDGDDTAYYLSRGYNVVAVEANPMMVEAARTRFAAEIQDRRLTLLNVGISTKCGNEIFWVSDRRAWSSFNRSLASRGNTWHVPTLVPVLTFQELVAEYGVPHYLKIDIEGHDRLCVEGLQGATLPTYISVETECAEDSEALSEIESTAMLALLQDVGYRRFKLVKQSGLTPIRSNRVAHFCKRVVSSLAQGRLRTKGLSAIASRFTDSAQLGALGFDFSLGSSGPWGEDVPGQWMSFEKAKSTYLREKKDFFARQREPFTFWYDWHATY